MSIDATTIQQAKASSFGQLPAWLWLGAGLYVLLLVNNTGLLNDSDTYWQTAVGQWILDHGACHASMSIRSACLAKPGFHHPGLRKSFMR